MEAKAFPVIDLVATGNNIRRLRVEHGLSVKDLQRYFGFEEPRAVYKWQKGECLPTVDNLYALGILLDTPMESILIRWDLSEQSYILFLSGTTSINTATNSKNSRSQHDQKNHSILGIGGSYTRSHKNAPLLLPGSLFLYMKRDR